MKKNNNTDILNLLSDPNQFETACELIDSFEEFKIQLLDIFSEKFKNELTLRLRNTLWSVHSFGSFATRHSFIALYSSIDKNKSIGYSIEMGKGQFYYGIRFEREECPPERIPLIFNKGKEFKTKFEWRMNKEKDSWWPIYYEISSLKLKSNSDYSSLLPHVLQQTTMEVADEFLNDFNQDIKDFIESSIF